MCDNMPHPGRKWRLQFVERSAQLWRQGWARYTLGE